MKEIKVDVLIVGGGVAASIAALTVSKFTNDVILVDKGEVGRSGTTPSTGGAIGAILPESLGGDSGDSPEIFKKDILTGGHNLNHPAFVDLFVSEGTHRVNDMFNLGLEYTKTSDGKLLTKKPLGESFPRVITPLDKGKGLMDCLRKTLLQESIRLHEQIMIVRLLTSQNQITGAIGVNCDSGELILYRCKTIIVAAGSATNLLPHSAEQVTSGDAYALGFQAGAALVNLEFLEFTLIPAPRGTPLTSGGLKLLTALGGQFFNKAGERFLHRYDPDRLELTTRSTLVTAIHNEIAHGRGPCVLDPTTISSAQWAKIHPQKQPLLRKLLDLGIDYKTEPIPWIPALHSFLGGIFVDINCQSSIQGLFAAGESAGHGGLFGADRVGSAIMACQLLGHQAGKSACTYIKTHDYLPVDEKELEMFKEGFDNLKQRRGQDPAELLSKIQKIAQQGLGVIRTEHTIQTAVESLEQIRTQLDVDFRSQDPHDLIKFLEARNLALTGKLVAHAAALRVESRGQHNRGDFPQMDNESMLKWTHLSKQNDKVLGKLIPIPK